MFLQISHVSKSYDSTVVVNDFSLDIQKGELLSLLGPSGCGKTTMIRMIGGFLTPDTGTITLDGQDITSLLPEHRPVATVFQNYALFPHLSVQDNIMYGLKKRIKDKNERAEISSDMLKLVGMKGYEVRSVSQLSGGQQQRVALARALVMKPKVLLLDEPLSNLDARLRVAMRKEIKRIQKELGTTMIFVTHDQEEAMSLSDRIVVMESGKLIQLGSAEQIYNQPNSEFVANFVGESNLIYLGDKLSVIRPEHIQLSPDCGLFAAIITDKVFLGAIVQYELKAVINQKSQVLTAAQFNHLANFSIGDKIYITLSKTAEV